MANKTIDQLNDGRDIQLSTARVEIQQGGSSLNTTVRPNPENQINIRNESQLEGELGVNLETSDNENITIVFDADMTLTKPIKQGDNTGIELRGSRVGIAVTYEGVGKMVQPTTPGVPGAFLFVENLAVVGDGTNSFIGAEISAFGFVEMIGVSLSNFASIGTIESPSTSLSRFSGFGIKEGLVFINHSRVTIDTATFANFSADNTTWFSFISNVASRVTIDDVVATNSTGTGDSLFFFDPNTPGDAITFDITSSQITDNVGPGIFYQQGTDIAIDSVTDLGGGVLRFTTAASHDLVVGKPFTTDGFVTETGYNNKTFIPIAVDTPLTGTTVDVVGTFTDDDNTGHLNAASLDNTDELVLARGNSVSPDSRFTGDTGLEIFGAEVTSSSLAQNAFEVVTSASWTSSKLQRFSEGVVNTGQLVCDDVKTRPYFISYKGTVEKDGGGSVNIGIIILKNGLNVAFNPPHTVNTGKIQIGGDDIVELTDTDTLDIAVINYDATATAIDTSQLSLVVSKA